MRPILHLVGARPQFVKVAAVLRAAQTSARHRLVHTGQHFDAAMSDVFFAELGIRAPDWHLGVGGGSHAAQTARMLAALEQVLDEVAAAEGPGVLVVYGDTNTTLAGALAAAKSPWGTVHVEAGLRSHDRTMPEEVNRVVADHLCSLRLCPTAASVDQLAREGIVSGVERTGDVMLTIAHGERARAAATTVGRWVTRDPTLGGPPPPFDRLPDSRGPYALATIHRAATTDEPDTLRRVVAALGTLAWPVLWPIHPRTRKALEAAHIPLPATLHTIEPVGYLEFAALLAGAAHVVTDSGGVQKEAFFAARPCTTLRDTTEWPETLVGDWNVLVASDPEALRAACSRRAPSAPPDTSAFGTIDAAARVAASIEAFAAL
ncbi:MAG: non-hydrolyzing UDP-N-acetylglucosamine 2-epimerase [Bradymonadia bacterium]